MDKKLNILFAASEVAGFAKTGGLADVAAALPKALKKMGHDVIVVMPRYYKNQCPDVIRGMIDDGRKERSSGNAKEHTPKRNQVRATVLASRLKSSTKREL